MLSLPTHKPKNITKRTGVGCLSIGLIFLFFGAGAFLLGAILGFENAGFIVFGSVFLTLGILGFIIGIGMFIQGRRVDKLMSGDDLIASWNYDIDEKGNRKEGYVYIGTKGFYKKGVYTEWARNCVLEDVFITAGEPDILTFQYVIYSHRPDMSSTPAVRKKTKVPVPSDSKEAATRAVHHYKRYLEITAQ